MFSKDAVNKGRQLEVDIAKSVLVFIFAFVHITIMCSSEETLNHGLAYFFDSIIGGPLGAPTFIFSMGLGMVYTKRIDFKARFRRGVSMFVIGYILNLCRDVIPHFVGYLITGNYEHYIEDMPYLFFTIDIMQFAGLSYILLAVMIEINMPKWGMVSVGGLMSVIAVYLGNINFKSQVLNILVGHFIGIQDEAELIYSEFPVFNWFIVLVCGYVFGTYLIRTTNKGKFYTILGIPCIIITIVYFVIGISGRLGMFGEGQNCYYHISTMDVLATIVATIGMFGIYYALSYFLPSKIISLTRMMSENLNAEFCIHWILVAWTIDVAVFVIRGDQELSMMYILPIAFAIACLSVLIAWFWKSKLRNK